MMTGGPQMWEVVNQIKSFRRISASSLEGQGIVPRHTGKRWIQDLLRAGHIVPIASFKTAREPSYEVVSPPKSSHPAEKTDNT